MALSDAKAIAELEHRTEVLSREYEGGRVRLRVKIGTKQADRLRSGGAEVEVAGT